MNYVKKSLKVSLVDAIVVSIFAAFFVRFPEEDIVVFALFFFPLFLLFFISSLVIAKSSKKEPISIFLYPFLKTDFATLKIPFILSLIACTVLFGLLLLLLIDILPFGDDITLGTIIFSISFAVIMRIGLIFMMRPETSTRGGIILLTIGAISMSAPILPSIIIIMFRDIVIADPPPQLFFLSCVVIVISGCLGMKRGEKYYANEILKIKDETGKIRHSNAPFVIPIISFIFAIVPVLVLVFAFVMDTGWSDRVAEVFIHLFLPFAAISTTLNIVGMFKIWRETNPKKKLIEKILIIITWCLIVFLVGIGLLSLWVRSIA